MLNGFDKADDSRNFVQMVGNMYEQYRWINKLRCNDLMLKYGVIVVRCIGMIKGQFLSNFQAEGDMNVPKFTSEQEGFRNYVGIRLYS